MSNFGRVSADTRSLLSPRTSETISAQRGDGCGANLDIALHCGRVNDHRQSRYTGLQITDKSDQNGVAVIPRGCCVMCLDPNRRPVWIGNVPAFKLITRDTCSVLMYGRITLKGRTTLYPTKSREHREQTVVGLVYPCAMLIVLQAYISLDTISQLLHVTVFSHGVFDLDHITP